MHAHTVYHNTLVLKNRSANVETSANFISSIINFHMSGNLFQLGNTYTELSHLELNYYGLYFELLYVHTK